MESTEILLSNGERLEVDGSPQDVESEILAAARGSIMELVWLTEAATRRRVAVNPDYVMAIGDVRLPG